MEPVRLQLFGTPTLIGSGARRPLAPERMSQLALVLAARGDWVLRHQLVALLWPELPEESARRNLRKLLFRARTQSWFDGLEVRVDALRWRIDTDLAVFESACGRSDWDGAIDAYRGGFGEGFERGAAEPFIEWLRFERHRLTALARTATAARLAQLGDDAAARARLARSWLALDPLDEDVLIALVDALRAQGQGAEAQLAIAEFSRRLEEEVGVAMSTRLRALASGEVRTTIPAPAMPAKTDFVGRRAERLGVLALVARDECRALTLTGPGGIGKSRLARAMLPELAPQFESVHWIGLEDLTDVEQVGPRIADVLGIALVGATDALTRVAAALRERCTLLVLDNAEHLADLAASIDRLLHVCPRLKLLITSRARLALAGEWLLPLAGLPVPDADETESDVLRAFDAVKLFELRACAAAPAFAPAQHASDVARLVRMLEGAPLAIELAAAWVRLLPVSHIAKEIERSLDLLEGAAHAPDRQRSVRASFEHSWRSLTPVEQRALAQLSAFAAPFTREAAAHVAGSVHLPVLAALVDKSLLRAEGDGRFSFHALMQQCARERLVDAQAVRQRHCDYFARRLAAFGDGKIGQAALLAALDSELEDVRAAWRYALETRNAAALEAMAAALARYLEIRARKTEGIALIGAAVRALGDLPAASGAIAALHYALATLHFRNGELDRAEVASRTAIRLYRLLRRSAAMRRCVSLRGAIALTRGDIAAARQCFEQALSSARAAGDEAGCAAPLNGLAGCARTVGDHAKSLALQREALRLHEALGNVHEQATLLNDIGVTLYTLHRYAEAKGALERGLRLTDRHELASAREFCLFTLGMAEIELGQLEAARAHLLQSLAIDRVAGVGLVSSAAHLGLARVCLRSGDTNAAAALLHEGLGRARTLGSVLAQMYALGFIAEWLAEKGQRDRAAALWMFIGTHRQSEAADRDDAQRALEKLRLSSLEAAAAARAAGALVLDSLVESLLTELAP